MKKFLSNPAVAMVIAVIVVIGSILINTRVKLGSQCDVLNAYFYETGTEEVSVAGSLRSFCNAVEQILILGEKYDLNDLEETQLCVDNIRDALRSHSYDTGTIYKNYDQLLKNTFSIESSLARTSLSPEDKSSYDSAQHNAAEAKAAIDSSSYNDSARRFLKKNTRFPTPQLAAVTGVQMPELFA